MDSTCNSVAPKEDECAERRAAVKNKIEKLMSMDHLATTPSLVTRLDSEGYLSLSYLMSLSSISKTGISRSELIDVIRTIPTLSLSPTLTGVRVSIPVARKTVILRDLPADTTEDMVRSLFEGVTIESIKEEISNSWFVTFSTEEEALSSLNSLQTRTFAGAPIKARMKSEYYMKVFTRQLSTILGTPKNEPKHRRMSADATPFDLSDSKLEELTKTLQSKQPLELSADMDEFSLITESNKYKGFDIDLFPDYGKEGSTLPFVATSSVHIGYKGEFIRYTSEQILEIVHNMKDQSMPPIATPGDHSLAIEKTPNTELVTKGRTMSIDHAMYMGHPRTLSVDSVDYTNMIAGEMEEEVASYVRKQRRHRNRRRLLNK